MIALTGDTRDKRFVEQLRGSDVGRMFIDRKPTIYPGEKWGFDNGAYSDWINGRAFDGSQFLRRYERAREVGTPVLAVLPDRVAEGDWSLEFSLRWLDQLDPWNWFLAVQDGMTTPNVSAALEDERIVGVFLGGTDRFKGREGRTYSRIAKKFGKRFHFARAGTPRRILFARDIESDSLDSAFPLWNRTRFEEFLALVEGAEEYQQRFQF